MTKIYSRNDVGDVPGRLPLAGAAKDAIAAEWNAEGRAEALERLQKAFVREAASRIAAQVPAWDTYKGVKWLVSIWSLLGGTPTLEQMRARDICQYVEAVALPKLATLDRAELARVVVKGEQPFSLVDPIDLGWPT